jgi:hypothetical protein
VLVVWFMGDMLAGAISIIGFQGCPHESEP